MIDENMKIKFKREQTPEKSELNYILWKFEEIKRQYKRQDLTIMHNYNGGQMRFYKGRKPIFVDGYIPELGMILQHHGCYWHGHECMKGKMDEGQRVQKPKETEEIRQFLRTTGKILIEDYECPFQKEPGVAKFVDNNRLKGRRNQSAGQLLNMVLKEELFGLVECDLQVSLKSVQSYNIYRM